MAVTSKYTTVGWSNRRGKRLGWVLSHRHDGPCSVHILSKCKALHCRWFKLPWWRRCCVSARTHSLGLYDRHAGGSPPCHPGSFLPGVPAQRMGLPVTYLPEPDAWASSRSQTLFTQRIPESARFTPCRALISLHPCCLFPR